MANTKTSNFLLPLIGYSIDFFQPYLIESFLKEEREELTPYRIYSVFKWNKNINYEEFLNTLRNNPNYRGEFSLHGSDYTVMLFEIPDKFKLEYDLFLKGKYSQFSKEAKEQLLKGRSPQSSMSDILSKSTRLREHWEKELGMRIPSFYELYSIYNIEEETLKRTDYKPLTKEILTPNSEFDF